MHYAGLVQRHRSWLQNRRCTRNICRLSKSVRPSHAILLSKLAASGVNRGFWKWTQSFLTGRTLQVKLPGALSKVGQVIAGVPQGGVISLKLLSECEGTIW